MNKDKLLNALKLIFHSFIWVMVLVFILDITTKWGVQNNLHSDIVLIPNFLSITLTHNLGASFGMLSDGSIGQRVLWICVSVLMSFGLIFYYVKEYKKLNVFYRLALSLMIAGAIGNMIDRIFYWKAIVGFDGVIDWIAVILFNSYHFPVFNIADSSLVIGVCIIIVLLIVDLIKEAIEKNKQGAYSMTPTEFEEKQKAEQKKKNSEETENKNEEPKN